MSKHSLRRRLHCVCVQRASFLQLRLRSAVYNVSRGIVESLFVVFLSVEKGEERATPSAAHTNLSWMSREGDDAPLCLTGGRPNRQGACVSTLSAMCAHERGGQRRSPLLALKRKPALVRRDTHGLQNTHTFHSRPSVFWLSSPFPLPLPAAHAWLRLRLRLTPCGAHPTVGARGMGEQVGLARRAKGRRDALSPLGTADAVVLRLLDWRSLCASCCVSRSWRVVGGELKRCARGGVPTRQLPPRLLPRPRPALTPPQVAARTPRYRSGADG